MSDVYKRLYDAIKEHAHLEDETIIDAGKHGADAGWGGFTYYKDTCAFYEKNSDDIWELLSQMADDMGEKNPVALIAGFNRADSITDKDTFENLLAWFALEEVGRWLEDNPQEQSDEEKEETESES